jgi:hypothetical protein
MSRETSLIRRAIRRHLLPALDGFGFHGGASSFRRVLPDCLDLLSVQFWKHGGEFILEFARCQRGDLTTAWGETVPEARLEIAYVSPLARARLVKDTPHSTSGFFGFEFAGFGEDGPAYDALVQSVASLLPQVDAWLVSGAVGANIRPFSPAMQPGARG